MTKSNTLPLAFAVFTLKKTAWPSSPVAMMILSPSAWRITKLARLLSRRSSW
jgi:hypothetical protein